MRIGDRSSTKTTNKASYEASGVLLKKENNITSPQAQTAAERSERGRKISSHRDKRALAWHN
jgi:hypothetical protein